MTHLDQAYRLQVQVTALLGTKSFMGEVQGRHLKCRAVPDNTALTVGDHVIVTRLEGSTEYFWWQQAVAVDPYPYALYFAPGRWYNLEAIYVNDLWKISGGVLSTVWTAPVGHWITALAWSTITHKLYVFTYEPPGSNCIYELDTLTDAIVLVATYTHPAIAGNEAAIDVAEFGDKLYVHHSGYNGNYPWLGRFDPVTYSIASVIAYDGFAEYSIHFLDGGGCASDANNSNLYWSDGDNIYKSSTGDPGTWTLIYTISDDWTLPTVTGGNMVLDRTNDVIYIAGGGCNTGGVSNFVVYRLVGGVVTLDFSTPTGATNGVYAGLVGIAFVDIVTEWVCGVSMNINPGPEHDPTAYYRRNGVWNGVPFVFPDPDAAVSFGGQGLTFYNGSFYLLGSYDLPFPGWEEGVKLYKHAGGASWTIVQDFPDYIWNHVYGSCLTVVGSPP